jgi:multicomponent Na+:H+ antiporter subunit G
MTEIAIILMFLGSVFILIASIGLLRFRESFSRMHATTKATSFGLLLILVGVSLYFLSLILVLKALLVIIFIYLTAPLAAHSISRTIGKTGKD